MIRLRTRMDIDNKSVYWRTADQQEMPLKEFLQSEKLAFNPDSCIHVYIKNGSRVYAKLEFRVNYDIDSDLITIDGLFGRFTGPVFDIFYSFGNTMVEFAEKYGAKCQFFKYYYAEPSKLDVGL